MTLALMDKQHLFLGSLFTETNVPVPLGTYHQTAL
jgi:hypothetical protein